MNTTLQSVLDQMTPAAALELLRSRQGKCNDAFVVGDFIVFCDLPANHDDARHSAVVRSEGGKDAIIKWGA